MVAPPDVALARGLVLVGGERGEVAEQPRPGVPLEMLLDPQLLCQQEAGSTGEALHRTHQGEQVRLDGKESVSSESACYAWSVPCCRAP